MQHVSKDQYINLLTKHRGTDKSLARLGRKQATATEDFEFIVIIEGILVLFLYITRLA